MKRQKLLQCAGAVILCFSMVIGNFSLGSIKRAEAEGVSEEMQDTKTPTEVKTGSITVNGNDISADNVNGLTFKGFGVLSGNSSSDLLMDYKSQNPEQYAKMMQYLFGGEHPIMNHVKIEMGNDQNNSTGADPCTKRYKEEVANVSRDPGFQLAADAKKINPNLKVSILRWNAPKWVTSTKNELIYQWYKETVLAAYERYGYMVDYINPNVNESWSEKADVARTKYFAQEIAEENEESIPDKKALALYKKIKLVVSDESGVVNDDVAQDLKEDKDFYNAVAAVGYHYSPQDDSQGGMKWLAETEDKEVWNSEAQATFSNTAFRPTQNGELENGAGIGGVGGPLEMGNTIIKGFVLSRRTNVIYQPAIASFYEGGQYSYKELVSARDPWSGWMHYDAGLLVLAHVSKFAVTGWENDTNTAGIWRAVPQASKSTAEGDNPVNGRNGGENYMTLAAPTKDNFSTVIMNDSQYPMVYTVKTENMNLSDDQKLAVWETRGAEEGAFNENYMVHREDVSKNEDGTYTISVAPYSATTVTTLVTSETEEEEMKLPVEGTRTVLDTDVTGEEQNTEDKYLYADDFDYTGKTVPVLDGKGGFTGETEDYLESRGGAAGAMARYTWTTNGAFEAYKINTGNYVLRQQLDQYVYGKGKSWNSSDPATLIGDVRWMNYAASVDVCYEDEQEGQYGQVSIRHVSGTHDLMRSAGYTFRVYQEGNWKLYRKYTVVDSGTLGSDTGFKAGCCVWNNIKLAGAGNVICAYVNNHLVATFEDDNPITAGRVGLGCAYTFTDFDNLKITKIDGYAPYYSEILDNMETYDLTPEKNTKLVYNDLWSHQLGQGMYCYQRSQSVSTEAGATLTYEFEGTGLEVLGYAKNLSKDDLATLEVTVDDVVVDAAAKARNIDFMNANYILNNLEYGKHKATIKVLSGTLIVDAVAVIGKVYDGKDDVEDELNLPENPEKPIHTPQPGETPDISSETTQPAATEEQTPTPANPQPAATLPATENSAPSTEVAEENIKTGKVVTIGNNRYTITNVQKKTVALKGIIKKNISKANIPASVKIKVNGKKTSFKVTEIKKNAFHNCKNLKVLNIAGKLSKVAKGAFRGCKESIKIKGKYKKKNAELLRKKSGYLKIELEG